MLFFDTLKVDDAKTRYTRDGYLVASALTARTGVQVYTARDLGLTDRDPSSPVRVYRPPEAVFADKAIASMAYRPITDGHPQQNVTAKNWKDLATGNTGGEVMRDGDFVRIPLILMDEDAIQSWRDGKRELSWGYSADVVLRDGIVPEGQLDAGKPFDAIQDNISCNHLARCDAARGGERLNIPDHQPGHRDGHGAPTMKTIIIDGIPVADVSDAAAAVISTLQARVADSLAKIAGLEKVVADHVATISAKDGELAVKDKAIADAAMTPEKLGAAVAARAAVLDSAKKILGADFDGSKLTDAEIRKAAVTKHLGDAAASFDDAGITAAFATIHALTTKDGGVDTIRSVVIDGLDGGAGDAATKSAAARQKMIDSYTPAKADA